MPAEPVFLQKLTEKLLLGLSTRFGAENWDGEVLGRRKASKKQVLFDTLASILNPLLSRGGYQMGEKEVNLSRFKTITGKFGDGLQALYAMLSDESSRDLLVEVMAYRILGSRHVKLAANNEHYWGMRAKASNLRSDARGFRPPLKGKPTSFYDLNGLGFPLTAYGYPPSITHTFLSKHYTYDCGNQIVGICEGDVVIDAGACWGDTSLLFSHETGNSGRVFAFEFEPANLKILDEVLKLNPELADRISIVRKALWNHSGDKMSFVPSGPGTKVSSEGGADQMQVESLSIDDLSDEFGEINFIKMDIEGAELEALRGAERTIRTYRPRLAISLYHSLSDFVTIPAFLDSLKVGYQYFLKHPTIFDRETVLFTFPGPTS